MSISNYVLRITTTKERHLHLMQDIRAECSIHPSIEDDHEEETPDPFHSLIVPNAILSFVVVVVKNECLLCPPACLIMLSKEEFGLKRCF